LSQPKAPVKEPVRRFPFVCKGMNVLWHEAGNPQHPGCAATVTEVGEMGLDLSIQEPDYDRLIRKTGVRWNHEPNVSEAVRDDSGGWDFTENDLRVRAIFDDLTLWPEQLQRANRAEPPTVPVV
jgi:hypothetical protein